jgi:hypothetical protein
MSGETPVPRKRCTVCGRPMIKRKKWALAWHGVKYCSDRCRRIGKKNAESGLRGNRVTLP